MNLEELRTQIDAVDRQIVQLLNQRCQLVSQVGAWKKTQNRPVYVPEREALLMQKLHALNTGILPQTSLEVIYREIISAAIQLESPLKIGVLAPSRELPPTPAKTRFGHAVQVVEFADLVALRAAFQHQEVDYIVLPTATATGEYFQPGWEFLADFSGRIIAEFEGQVGEHLARFLILGAQNSAPTGHDKTSMLRIACEEEREPASLALWQDHMIAVPYLVNEYELLVEVSLHQEDEEFKKLYQKATATGSQWQILGSYPREV